MWSIIWKKFDITCAAKIGSIAVRVISKSFIEFATIEKFCRIYQQVYDNIASWLANKKGHKDQIKHYKVFLQEAILDKLPEAYALVILAIDKD